ncbi:MAG: tRNA lysidine(34) synthetase TilS, partial [Gemmatimonadaceae bacterium]|nr:tRNA lysidine(34) synthetase TilS [Gemmatimonadaceae bacterium]
MNDPLAALVAQQLRGRRVVLAVSGGRDSMALLHAAVTHARDSIVAVASFDHATGPHSARARSLVARVAGERGVEAITERATTVVRTEAAWRAQRWRFLDRVARERKAQIATAHTRDDQIETVLMRVMRGAGARGLASLAGESAIVRPMLASSRADVAAYADRAGIAWIDDPSNVRADHLRNRIRHDLLPALARARPSLPDELLALG